VGHQQDIYKNTKMYAETLCAIRLEILLFYIKLYFLNVLYLYNKTTNAHLLICQARIVLFFANVFRLQEWPKHVGKEQ